MRFIQHSCRETDSIDSRQSEAVMKHRPDAIVFEAPSDRPSLSLSFNKYSVTKKPISDVYERQKMLKRVSRNFPWVASDIEVYKNIVKLWKQNHDVKLFHVDAPSDLLKVSINSKWNKISRPRRRGVHFQWWVYIYLRERMMANNLERVIKTLPEDSIVLVFLEKFHWLHVQFLLNKPSKKEIFKYYFSEFKNLTPVNIKDKVEESQISELNKYWSKVSDFVM